MTTLPNMGLILPTRGAPGAGVWDDTIDADLSAIDAHNHGPGAGALVPTAGLNINADLSFSSLYAATNLQRLTFSSVAALAANNKSLFVNAADNELYWRSNAGSNVKLTAGAALNVSAFAGGIGGDYSAVGAAAAFDDAGDRYTWKQQGGVWARMASGEIRIIETGTSESVFVGQAAPSALASSYTVTWPLALPGATAIAQVDATGVTTWSNTIVNDLTMTANKNVVISGTGLYKHGSKTVSVIIDLTSLGTGRVTGPVSYQITSIPVGSRITSTSARIQDSVTGPTKLVSTFASQSDGSPTSIATSAASSGAGTVQTLTNSGLTTVVSALKTYTVGVSFSSGSATCSLFAIDVTYDQP